MASSQEGLWIPDQGETQIIPATDGTGCVDPRRLTPVPDQRLVIFRQEEDLGEERAPGGSFGKMMAVKAVRPDLHPLTVVKLVTFWEGSHERLPEAHQTIGGHGGFGCGHVDLAASGEYEDHYGLHDYDVEDMLYELFEMALVGRARVGNAALEGPHIESGVFVVHSLRQTVVPRIGDKEFFRFDQTRHEDRLTDLAAFARDRDIDISAEALIAAATKQRNTTLRLLAPRLPIYDIDLTKPADQQRVQYVGDVVPLAA